MQNDKIISIDSLTCIYDKKTENQVIAIDNFNANFERNKIHYIIGNSGSGKSTLILHFNGLLKSKQGNLNIDGFEIKGKNKKIKNIKDLRKKISLVFQYPEYQLFKDTIEKDISFGPKALKLHENLWHIKNKDLVVNHIINNFDMYKNIINCENNYNEINRSIIKIVPKKTKIILILCNKKKVIINVEPISIKSILHELAKENLVKMGLDESFLSRNPFELSGGQKRRVAIAGILAIDPNILVFDEPTAGLDPEGIKETLDLICNAKKNGKTIFVITHSMDEVLEIGDTVTMLDLGKIIFYGEPYEIFKNREIYQRSKIAPPKVIDTIFRLEEKNKKFSKLWDIKPKTCEELAEAITKVIKGK